MKNNLTIRKPDDWHLHLRDGEMLKGVAPISARIFSRAIIMPNLNPPVICAIDAANYRERILAALPNDSKFEPLMTLYLSEQSDTKDVAAAIKSGLIKAVKLYPAGATTNSQSGISDFSAIKGVLECLAEYGTPLCIHGEVTDPNVDIFDREAVFIDKILDPIRRSIPQLRIILEHVTTSNGIQYVKSFEENIAATLTTHHLVINRNDILAGGIRPHNYCPPIAKREPHRLALRAAATSGDKRFFLGTDSAPHTDKAKLSACGCAGCFTAPNTMNILAHIFEEEEALNQLEAFTSLNGPEFYLLKPNEEQINLIKRYVPVEFPKNIQIGGELVTVFDPGYPLFWHVN